MLMSAEIIYYGVYTELAELAEWSASTRRRWRTAMYLSSAALWRRCRANCWMKLPVCVCESDHMW